MLFRSPRMGKVVINRRFLSLGVSASYEENLVDDAREVKKVAQVRIVPHYGMGLFFAKTVAEKYGGGIKLSNSENTGGARVEIFFLSSHPRFIGFRK